MSHGYLNDLYGRSRKGRKTKFTDLEDRAKRLMENLLLGKVSYDDFFTGFNPLLDEFIELSGKVIDENTPLWFNSFGVCVFLRWREWHFLRKTFQEYPDRFNTPEALAQYKRIEAMNYDKWLKEKIKYYIDRL